MKRKHVWILVTILSGTALALWVWTAACESGAHRQPSEERVSIIGLLEKAEITETEAALLEEQTGLCAEGILWMYARGRQAELEKMQEQYYAPVRVSCRSNSPVSREETVTDGSGNAAQGMMIPWLEDGDILVTRCSHCFGWRNGHAGLVIDADRRLVLEAQVLGTPSVITSLDRWEQYPSFLVLRLKDADQEERAKVAAYASEHLVRIPYRLTAGLWKNSADGTADEAENIPEGTQCAHLVWYAYRHFGYDLDSDKGLVVTPQDLAESPLLEVIQSYGN